ncbi:MAG: hypothetical protein ACK58L_18240 [Planctomycetota bacterium]
MRSLLVMTTDGSERLLGNWPTEREFDVLWSGRLVSNLPQTGPTRRPKTGSPWNS